MIRRHENRLWRLDEASLPGITPEGVRDLVIACFFHAQKETYARAKKDLGFPGDDASVMESVRATVRLAMDQVGCSWDRPTADDLARLVDLLATKAATFGTPEEIVRHHREQIERALRCLGARAGGGSLG